MNDLQKLIKFFAMIFAGMLAVTIVGAVIMGICMLLGLTIPNISNGNEIFSIGSSNVEVVTLSKEYTKEEIAENGIDRIVIETSASVIVKEGAKLSIVAKNVPDTYELTCKDGLLRLRDEKSRNVIQIFNVSTWMKEAEVIVTVPNGYKAELFDISSGSGSVEITKLTAEKFVLDSGSGRVTIEGLNAQHTELDTGSGAIHLNDSTLGDTKVDSGSGNIVLKNVVVSNMQCESGSGRVDFIGEMSGNSSFRSGSGSISLTLSGAEEDYRISTDSGSGGFWLNGSKKDDGVYGRAVKGSIDFRSGSGRVQVEIK